MKCWSSSLLVHSKRFYSKTQYIHWLTGKKRVLLEIHDSTHSWSRSQCGSFLSIYVKMTNIKALLCLFRVDISFFEMVDISFWNEWHFTLTEHRPVQSPLCLSLFTLTSIPLKEFVFVDCLRAQIRVWVPLKWPIHSFNSKYTSLNYVLQTALVLILDRY